MIFLKQKIKDVFIIKKEPFEDKRGSFRRNFCKKEFKKFNLNTEIKQTNISVNHKKGTLRGFHYQVSPYGENKTITCISGKIYDIVVDLRKKSKTYLQWQSFELSGKNKESIVVPKGCANAFLSLEKNTILHYFSSQYYSPKHERGIRFNDPFFNFKWPNKIISISDKDLNHPDYK